MKTAYLFFVIIISVSCKEKYTGEISFESCQVKYDVLDGEKEKQMYGQNMVGNQWRLESAKQELALCLCEKYLQNLDKEIKNKILEIYHDDFEYYHREINFKPVDFDSILENRKKVFDYRIVVD